MSMIIELRDAAMTYQAPDGEVEALAGVSFAMEEGEFCSIVGPPAAASPPCWGPSPGWNGWTGAAYRWTARRSPAPPPGSG